MNRDPKQMSFWEHFEELRHRLFFAVLALAVTTVGSLFFTQRLLDLLAVPVGSLSSLQSIEVTENISVYMRVALLSGVVLSMPIILYQLLAFIVPGLNDIERRWVFIFIVAGTVLFLTGVAFAYFVMLPASLTFLLEFLAVETKPRLINYISFITNLLFWMGVAFQTPLLVFALAKLRVVSARTLAKQWRVAVVVIAVLAAVITPTVDPINMALLMTPLILLYFLSVLLAFAADGAAPRTGNDKED